MNAVEDHESGSRKTTAGKSKRKKSSPCLISSKSERGSRPPKRARTAEALQDTAGSRSSNAASAAAAAGTLTANAKAQSNLKSSSGTKSKTKTNPNRSKELERLRASANGDNGSKPSTGERTNRQGKLTGLFTPEEVRALEDFKTEFCNAHGLPAAAFESMLHHNRQDKVPFPYQDTVMSKNRFWQQIYHVVPDRDQRSVYRFMKRHFPCSTQQPHHWTEEQDEELISLHSQYGPKWFRIARLLGRSDDDVVQRWKNKLEHRYKMRRGPWLQEEVEALLETLAKVWKSLKADGNDVGKDIYEMRESLIAWGFVSDQLNNSRSRQQCADKWRKITYKIMKERVLNGNPDAVSNPAAESRCSRTKPKSPAERVRKAKKRSYKSAEFVHSDEDSDNESPADEDGSVKEDVVDEEGKKSGRRPDAVKIESTDANGDDSHSRNLETVRRQHGGEYSDSSETSESEAD